MKTMNIFFLILTFFGVSMCNAYSGCSSGDYEKLANEITDKTAKKLHDEKGLILVGTGGRMMDDIKMMMMSFEFRKVVNIEMARELLVNVIEEYLSEINADKKIRPYLHDYPFTAKNLEIEIVFRNPDGSKVASGKINVASADEGKIFYFVDYPEKHTLKILYEETYDQAIQAISS